MHARAHVACPSSSQFPLRLVPVVAGPQHASPAPKPSSSAAHTHLQAVKEELASSGQGSSLGRSQSHLQPTPSIAPLTMSLHHPGGAPRLLTSEFLARRETGSISEGRQEHHHQEQEQQQQHALGGLSHSIPKTHTYLGTALCVGDSECVPKDLKEGFHAPWKAGTKDALHRSQPCPSYISSCARRQPQLLPLTPSPFPAHLDLAAGTCICADGGSNRLHDELPAMMPEQDPEAVRRR
eukprot:908398-Pelagomonas_calceolata.AAC.11